jgi:hypothetical protein
MGEISLRELVTDGQHLMTDAAVSAVQGKERTRSFPLRRHEAVGEFDRYGVNF